jgi:hypothetical protein
MTLPVRPPALTRGPRDEGAVCRVCAGYWWRHEDGPDGRSILRCACAPPSVTLAMSVEIHDHLCCCEWLFPRARPVVRRPL